MRLIDAEKIEIPTSMIYGMFGCYMIRVEDVQRIISDQPVAFDKENVIEELKSVIGDIHYTEDGSFNGKCIEDFEFIQAKTALELVEKGGIE